MAKPVGDLVVRIGADIAGLRKGVAQADASLKNLATGMRSGINVVGKYAAAFTALGATLGVVMVRRTMDAIDAQSKLARQLHATNVGLETVMRAADLAGIEHGKMEKAVKRLDIAIGNALGGNKAAAEAFERLHLSAAEVSKMDADERIRAINVALMEFVPAAERAQVMGVLFGTKVAHALMEIDAATLGDAREEVEALGLALSEVDTRTVERANDAMSVIGETARGVANKIVAELAPGIMVISEKFREVAIETNGFQGVVTRVFTAAAKATALFADGLRGLQIVFKGLEVIGTGFGATVIDVVKDVGKGVAFLLDKIIEDINAAIVELNTFPGVDIELLSPASSSEFMKGLETLSAAMREQITIVRGEMHDLAMQEMPSQMLERFLARVKEVAAETSEEMNKAQAAIAAGGGEPGDGGGELSEVTVGVEKRDEEEADRRAYLASRLATLRESLQEEADAENEAYELKRALLAESFESALISQAEHDALLEDLEQQHQDRLTAITTQSLQERIDAEKSAGVKRVGLVLDTFQQMTAGVAQHSKALFQLNKVAAIADALVNAKAAVVGAYKFGANIGGPVLGAAFAATAAATTAAQIAAIKSTQFQGGGAGTAPSIAGTTPAPAVSPVGGAGMSAQQPQRLAIEGIDPNSLFSGRAVRELAERLKQHMEDGGEVVFA